MAIADGFTFVTSPSSCPRRRASSERLDWVAAFAGTAIFVAAPPRRLLEAAQARHAQHGQHQFKQAVGVDRRRLQAGRPERRRPEKQRVAEIGPADAERTDPAHRGPPAGDEDRTVCRLDLVQLDAL